MDNNNRTKEIAQTIISQLGRGTLFMLGAKQLMAMDGDGGLRFRIGRNGASVNCVTIYLTPADLYKVEFSWVTSKKTTIRSTVDGVYAEDLHNALETGTQMCARMPRFAGVAA